MSNELVALQATAELLSAANSISGLLSYRDISKIERKIRKEMAELEADCSLALYKSGALEKIATANINHYELNFPTPANQSKVGY